MLQPQEVIRVVGLLDSQNVSYWLDGGWGVDALAGEQTRQHQDLDLAILLSEAGIVIRLLNETGCQQFRKTR
jgi:lincosamide nucleotidyltransferase A/C/D/E